MWEEKQPWVDWNFEVKMVLLKLLGICSFNSDYALKSWLSPYHFTLEHKVQNTQYKRKTKKIFHLLLHSCCINFFHSILWTLPVCTPSAANSFCSKVRNVAHNTLRSQTNPLVAVAHATKSLLVYPTFQTCSLIYIFMYVRQHQKAHSNSAQRLDYPDICWLSSKKEEGDCC